ncbi:hypothetical protein [Qipengyuania sphaerica]|uniref:hypothetical protein n=1 Tax=Qipengyuania sphaerica TaxID=2867243 RepID=UPI001C872F2E|nr:hypothetical protein [Qipengyuania sphaerica]MBX7540487.1 hypothetical protein [Qipengyuania sphaerica]
MAKLDNIEPKFLLLDIENPRFGLAEAESQSEAIEILAQKANLRELWDSILLKGFEPFEPLVAFPDGGNFIVVEGNRRLAAVKSLLEPSLLANVKISVPELQSNFVTKSLEKIPVNVVSKRDEADDYIGFKHINGPSSWDALAKARFAVRLFEKMDLPSGNDDNRIEILGKRLGDGRQLILRSLVAFKIIEQSIELGYLDELEVKTNSLDFSHLYTMLPNRDVRFYLGLGEDPLNEASVVSDPIPQSHHDNLRYMMMWLFGDEKNRPLIQRQGSDRPKLQKVLSSQDATETLELTGDFERAVEEAGFFTDNWLADTVKLSTLSKSVADGITDLPPELSADDLEKANARLISSQRNVKSAVASLNSLFSDED